MSNTLTTFEQDYPVIIELPVQWGEMDAFNHVNNVTYFRYFESARIAYFEQAGLMERMKAEGVGPILASTECQYRRPVTYPDTLKIGARISEIQPFGFVQQYAIYSTAQDAIATQGSGRIVLLDYRTQKKVEPDEALVSTLKQLEGDRLSAAEE